MRNRYLAGTNTDAAGVVELDGISRMFYTPNFGAPDILLYSLLTSDREAYAATCRGTPREGKSPDGGMEAGTYMAGLLLRDDNFVPARVPRNYAHHYTLNFSTGMILVCTEVYVVDDRSANLFTVRLEGGILEDLFVVRNAVTGSLLVQVTEEDLKKPKFFSEEFPRRAFLSSTRRDGTTGTFPLALVDQSFELSLPILCRNEMRTVLVQKQKGDFKARIVDPETKACLQLLPIGRLNNLADLIAGLPQVLAGFPSPVAAQSAADSAEDRAQQETEGVKR